MVKNEWLSSECGSFVLRLFFGAAFLVAGLEKVLMFGMAKGMFEGFFPGLGAPMLVLAIFVELIGGVALLVGFYTRYAAGILALLILVAFVSTFKLGDATTAVSVLREIMVMNTGSGNTAVNYAYFAALLSLVFSGSSSHAVKPD